MSAVHQVGLCYSPLASRVVLAEQGAHGGKVHEVRDVTSEFLMALVNYVGEGELQFGTDKEQFVVSLRRVPVNTLQAEPVVANDR